MKGALWAGKLRKNTLTGWQVALRFKMFWGSLQGWGYHREGTVPEYRNQPIALENGV